MVILFDGCIYAFLETVFAPDALRVEALKGRDTSAVWAAIVALGEALLLHPGLALMLFTAASSDLFWAS